jgi:EpsI family protein
MKTQGRRFWFLIVLLLATGAAVHLWESKGEARLARAELRDVPTELGEWRRRGADARFDQASEAVLKADDYVLRDYSLPDGRTASLYVGYYASQRAGATYHSPLNCMPGSGWVLSSPAVVEIKPADGSASFGANAYVIQNASERYALVYWYHGRGRAVASEYRDKLYTVWDSIGRRRSDGSMVRVLVPIVGNEEDALKLAADLAARVTPELPRFVPN